MEKLIVYFKADEQELVCCNPFRVSSKKVAYVEAHFDLGENWTGYDSVRAIWRNTQNFAIIGTVLDSQGICKVPTEVLTSIGQVDVNLVGSISENNVLTDRLTTYPVEAGRVDANALVDGSETAEITPSQFEQFVTNVRSDAERAAQSAEDAEGHAEAAAGSAENAEQSAQDAAGSAASAADDAARIAQMIQDVNEQIIPALTLLLRQIEEDLDDAEADIETMTQLKTATETAAGNAAASATAAGQSATAAAASKTAAETAKGAAETAQTAAETAQAGAEAAQARATEIVAGCITIDAETSELIIYE